MGPTPAGGFDGYVLCGGGSRRMGRDKALVPVDGVAMARRVADALVAAGAERVFAVGGDVVALERLGLDARPDRWPGEGPLGGLVTALDDASTERARVAFVLPCDLTDPDPGAIVRTLAGPGSPSSCPATSPIPTPAPSSAPSPPVPTGTAMPWSRWSPVASSGCTPPGTAAAPASWPRSSRPGSARSPAPPSPCG